MRPTPHASAAAPRRMTPGGFSALLLLAVTVQMSLAMLEWAGPASADTRQRLATTIVAAAHRGVFTEPARSGRAKPPASVVPRVADPVPAAARGDETGPRSAGAVPWASAVPPPAV